jgi:hypothetical protein
MGLCISSFGVVCGELAGLRAESLVVFLEDLGDFGLQRVICVRVLQQRDETLNDEARVQCRHPVVLDCLCADLARVLLDVGVEDLRLEEHLRGLEWVVVGEVNVDDELATSVGRVCGANDGCVPVGQVVAHEGDAHPLDSVLRTVEVLQLLHLLVQITLPC